MTTKQNTTMKILTWAINALCYIQRTHEAAARWKALDDVNPDETTWEKVRPLLPYDARQIIQKHMADQKEEIMRQNKIDNE